MNILIIGDSWGVPNYFGSPGIDKEYHTEYLLRNLGYNVYNCSRNGDGNISSLERAKQFLLGFPISHPAGTHPNFPKLYDYDISVDSPNPKIDYIIWFHTEFFRNFDPTNMMLDQAILESANLQYSIISEFVKEQYAKLIVIGGQCPVRKELYNYIKPYFVIEDWRSEIIGKKLPEVYTLSRPESWLNSIIDGTDFKLELIEKHHTILRAMQESDDFPDNCHPGIKPHMELTKTLSELLKN
jgi:hypothetical protein